MRQTRSYQRQFTLAFHLPASERPHQMDRTPSKPKAALWMAGWLLQLLFLAIAGREAMREVNVFQLMEVRSALGFVMLIPFILQQGGFASMGTTRMRLQVGRNAAQFIAQLAWFLALTLIPIGEVVAIEFTMPIWTAILAAGFLGERMNTGKVLAIVLGLVGVIIIVRPGVSTVNHGQLIALGAAILFGASIAMVKSLTQTDSSLKITFWMSIIQSVFGLLPAIYFWVWPSFHGWFWLIVIAFCGTFSHYCMARAMLYADATIVVPMDFLRVPLTAIAGWLIYNEQIDLLTALGAALILFGNLLNLRSPSVSSPRSTQ